MCLITIFLGPVIRVIAVDYLEFTPFRGTRCRRRNPLRRSRPGRWSRHCYTWAAFFITGFRIECFYLLCDNLVKFFLNVAPGLAPVAVDFIVYALHLPDDLTVFLSAFMLGDRGPPDPGRV